MEIEPSIPISKILKAVSHQLGDLGMQVNRLEHHIGPLVTPEHDLPDHVLMELQALDRVRQSMEDLAAITGRLSKKVGDVTLSGQQVDVTQTGLQLDVSKAILQGECTNPLESEQGQSSAGIELF